MAAGRHERPPHLRQLAPIAAAVLLAALALVLSPIGGDRWLRSLAAVAVLVVALPGMAALDGLLRVSDRAAEQATARAEEAARLRQQVAELRREYDAGRVSTAETLDNVQRDLAATRAYARGGRDELVTAVERISALERGLSAARTEVGEVSARLQDAAADAIAARSDLADMRSEVSGTRAEVADTRAEVADTRAEVAAANEVVLAARAEAATSASTVSEVAEGLRVQLGALRTELAALRAELDARAEGVEATTVRMTLPLVRAALRHDPLQPATPAPSRLGERPRRTGS
ncbi:MAG TPA: hypothetical protein VLC50_01185 [Actinomycetes bacterium]|nr:hypothetical protein [Actinomycetes bacterium]